MNLVASSIKSSFPLGAALSAENPFTMQHHAGEHWEIYCANVGDGHFVCMFYDVRDRRGRIGTIWVFTQRAIKEILTMMPALGPAAFAGQPVEEQETPQRAEQVPEEETAVAAQPTPPPVSEPEPDFLDIEPEQLAALLNETGNEGEEVDDFWDEAVSSGTEVAGQGLSFAEAMKRGLIQEDLNGESE